MTTQAPLAGLRVLDLTRLLPGPVATLRLAELGAEVLKIEAPGTGDPSRTMLQSALEHARGQPSAFYRLVNRGKRETRLDLKSETGRTVLEALVRESHVLVESFRPGVMERLGLGYAQLAAVNPKLVYCAITGYGSTGPFSQRPGHDINYLAYAGVLDQIATRDGTPLIPNIQIADLLGGASTAVTQILAALWQVARGGEGAFLDVSMTHAMHANNVIARASLEAAAVRQAARPRAGRPGALAADSDRQPADRASNAAAGPTANGVPSGGAPEPEDTRPPALRAGGGLLNGGVPCYNVYRTADDRWLALGALELKFWERLCRALGRPDWAGRHWTLGQAIGGPDAAALTQELAERFASHRLAAWMALLEPLDCCVSPVLTVEEVRAHLLFRADDEA